MPKTDPLLVKRCFEDRAQAELERFLSFVDDDAEMDFSELDRPYGRVFRGTEEIKTLYREMTDPWQELSFETSSAIAAGEWLVIDVARTASSAAGLTVYSAVSVAVRLRDGYIVYLKVFQQRADALQVAGLSDEEPAAEPRGA